MTLPTEGELMEPYTDANGNELPSDGHRPLSLDLAWLDKKDTEPGHWYLVKEALPFIEPCPHEEFHAPSGYDRAASHRLRNDRSHSCNDRTSRDVLIKEWDGTRKTVRFLARGHGVRVGSGAMTTSYSWYPGGLPVCNSIAWMELPE